MYEVQTPFSDEMIEKMRAGDRIMLSGSVYTGRDAAHKRLVEMLDTGRSLPLDFSGQAIYYAGPCPAPPGHAIGSVGPTTSLRMDTYSLRLIQEGMRVMIGKGSRSKPVIDAIRRYTGAYLTAIGGTGALMALCVECAEVIAFEDLGAEAIYKLVVRDMPLVVAIDCEGGNIYEHYSSDKRQVIAVR